MIKRNLISNFSAKIWTLLFSIPFLPLYIKYLGMEAYGLVGFYLTLSGLLSVILDFGLSKAANREMARLSHDNIHNFARTLEWIYGLMALVIAIFSFFSASWFADNWFQTNSLPVKNSLICMGITIATLWPFSFYSGALTGLEKQVPLNLIIAAGATLRSVGSVLLLAWHPRLEIFFLWQAAVNLVQTLWARYFLWKTLPKGPAKFELESLKDVWKFSAGMIGISLTVIVLHNLDKIFLSHFLSLESFGSYMFANSIAAGLYHLTGPVYASFFPRLTKAAHNGDGLADLYHSSSKLVAYLILPIAGLLIFFTPEILKVWGAPINPELCKLIPLLTLGVALNNLMSMPYGLQLAHGWTRLTLYQNLLAISVLSFPWIFAVKTWGSIGSALILIILNIGYLLFTIPLLHRKILKGEMMKWYFQAVLLPILITLTVCTLSKLIFPTTLSKLSTFCFIASTWLIATISCFFVSRQIPKELAA